MEVDAVHSSIERAITKKEIWTTQNYIETADSIVSSKYRFANFKWEDFIDVKKLAKNLGIGSSSGRLMGLFGGAHRIRAEKQHPSSLVFADDFAGEFSEEMFLITSLSAR